MQHCIKYALYFSVCFGKQERHSQIQVLCNNVSIKKLLFQRKQLKKWQQLRVQHAIYKVLAPKLLSITPQELMYCNVKPKLLAHKSAPLLFLYITFQKCKTYMFCMCCSHFHSFFILFFILKPCKLLAIFSKTHFSSHKNSLKNIPLLCKNRPFIPYKNLFAYKKKKSQ